jgi:uncharacterized protein
MRPSEILPLHREKIRDLDILVDPAPRASLLGMEILQAKLGSETGLKVDLRTPGELHPKFRGRVLAEAVAL